MNHVDPPTAFGEGCDHCTAAAVTNYRGMELCGECADEAALCAGRADDLAADGDDADSSEMWAPVDERGAA